MIENWDLISITLWRIGELTLDELGG